MKKIIIKAICAAAVVLVLPLAGCMNKSQASEKSDQNITAPATDDTQEQPEEPDIVMPNDDNELPPPPHPRKDGKRGKRPMPPIRHGDDGEIIIPEPAPNPEK